MKIISFINNGDAALKTTLANNIAVALSSMGMNFLLLNMTAQGSAISHFGLNSENSKITLLNLFKDNSKIEKSINHVYEDLIGVINSDSSLSMVETDIESKTISSQDIIHTLGNIMSIAKQAFDYLLIDCASAFGRITSEILNLSDEIIVPYSMEQISISGSVNIHNAQKLDKNFKWLLPILFKPGAMLYQIIFEHLLKHMGAKEIFKISQKLIKVSIQTLTNNFLNKKRIWLTETKNNAKNSYFDIIKEKGSRQWA